MIAGFVLVSRSYSQQTKLVLNSGKPPFKKTLLEVWRRGCPHSVPDAAELLNVRLLWAAGGDVCPECDAGWRGAGKSNRG